MICHNQAGVYNCNDIGSESKMYTIQNNFGEAKKIYCDFY